jgi:RsiW-degrading membrane proteinase PrsW (M82 family)
MYPTIAFIMAVAPALFLVRHYYLADKRKPEPKKLIVKIFFLGILSTIPVIIIELCALYFGVAVISNRVWFLLFKAFFVAGLCEEFMKLQVVKRFAYNDTHFDEVMDGIVYTVVASLGFACMENILYVMNGGMRVAIARAFTAVPMHAVCSGIMGYYIGKAKFSRSEKEGRALMRKGLYRAVGLHGLYDFLLFMAPIAGVLLAALVIPLIIMTYRSLKSSIRSAIWEDVRSGRVQ